MVKIFVYMSQCKQKDSILFFQKVVYHFATSCNQNHRQVILGKVDSGGPQKVLWDETNANTPALATGHLEALMSSLITVWFGGVETRKVGSCYCLG